MHQTQQNDFSTQNESIASDLYQKKIQLSETRTLTVGEILKDKVAWTSDVTGIPIGLLWTPHLWEQPIDMMVYLHFFSHSFGRNRRWCSMGILELQEYCAPPKRRTSKNTIRDSLKRLAAKKLIECIEPEAANQITRKWLVRTPFEADLDPSIKKESWNSVHNFETQSKPESKADAPFMESSQIFKPAETKCASTSINNHQPSPAPVPNTGSTVDPVMKQPGHIMPQAGSTNDPEEVNNRPREGQNLTQTGSESDPYKHPLKDPFINPIKHSSLKSELSEIFENYFSNIRSPIMEKKERAYFNQILKRNPDVTQEEFLECFNFVSESKDTKGAPISMKFLWMANGFDSILPKAKQRIQSRKRREEERQKAEQRAKEDLESAQKVTPEEAERARNAIRAMVGCGLFMSLDQPQKSQSEQERRAFLLAQARQIEKFGRL